MADAPMSVPLTTLQTELNGAKTQWDKLQDEILIGYKNAYKLHRGALEKMHQARLIEEQEEARIRGYYMFVLSAVAVGAAGGLVGGLVGNWLESQLAIRAGASAATIEALAEAGLIDASKETVKRLATPTLVKAYGPVVRETIKGIGSEGTKKVVGLLVPPNPSANAVPASPYAPVSPEPFEVYLEKKAELDGCFALVNQWLMAVKERGQ